MKNAFCITNPVVMILDYISFNFTLYLMDLKLKIVIVIEC